MIVAMTSRTRALILLFVLAGLGVSAASTLVHHRVLTDPSYVSPCDINEKFNCSQVYLSQYGSVKGVPVALGGILWFGLVGLIAWFGRTDGDPKTRVAGAYIFALSTIGLAVVLSLAYVSFVVLKTGCVLCMTTYVCVIAIFIISGMSQGASVGSLPGRFAGDMRDALSKPARLGSALVLAAVVAALVVTFPAGNVSAATAAAAQAAAQSANAPAASADLKQQFEEWWNAQPRIETGVPLEGAKVVIVKFSDFQCPGCRQTYMMYKPVIEKYTATPDVRYVMKDFPLNSACNVAVQTQMHPFACDAAVANRAAEARGKGAEMEQWIFDNQPMLTAQTIRDAAARIAGVTDLDAELPKFITRIRKDTADGGALAINQTPTYYINGVKLPNTTWLSTEFFDYAIQLELKRAASAGK